VTDLLATGAWHGALEILAPLHEAGYRLTLAPDGDRRADRGSRLPALLLVALGGQPPSPVSTPAAGERALPWLCWNRDDDPACTLAAYSAGALAVLPAALTGSVLLQSVRSALTAVGPPRPVGAVERRYEREELLLLERDAVLDVREGVVAQTVIHADGTEVLLGFCGPGQLLVGHPEDSCCLQLVAHTDAVVTIRDWGEVTGEPGFPERLRARLRQMEAWSAAQARHYLDQRVLGILGLLAEQFGAPREGATLIDVRITHAQLAAAVGATRTTVTRLLGDLRSRGLVSTVGVGAGERFCLHEWDRVDHDLR
jgi:hypothetical protein